MAIKIVNPNPRYPRPRLMAPSASGYIHLAAAVDPPRGRVPLVRGSARRQALLVRLKDLAKGLTQVAGVDGVSVYRAVLLPTAGSRPPWAPEGAGAPEAPAANALDEAGDVLRPVPYDVALLVTTSSVDRIPGVRDAREYRALVSALEEDAQEVHQVPARCARRLADVPQTEGGLFLFNHFLAADPDEALHLWEHLAGWYVVETELRNSVVMQPVDGAPYSFVNHARWDVSLPTIARRQFTKKTFQTYVLANLRAHRVRAMPALYRLA